MFFFLFSNYTSILSLPLHHHSIPISTYLPPHARPPLAGGFRRLCNNTSLTITPHHHRAVVLNEERCEGTSCKKAKQGQDPPRREPPSQGPLPFPSLSWSLSRPFHFSPPHRTRSGGGGLSVNTGCLLTTCYIMRWFPRTSSTQILHRCAIELWTFAKLCAIEAENENKNIEIKKIEIEIAMNDHGI